MFEQCLYFNTTALARTLERAWTQAFKPFGLTPAQAFMLRVLLDQPALTGTELALALHISKATCSRGVDGLVGLGLVRKLPADQDGRSHALQPTPKARALREGLNQASAAVTRKIKQSIGTDSFEDTVRQLRHVHASVHASVRSSVRSSAKSPSRRSTR